MTPKRTDVKPFEYVEANVPYYPPSPRWGVTGEPIKRMQKPLDPAESMKHYVHPVGFELKLFVADEQLGGKPICLNWDERGRLWVAVTVDYPNDRQPAGQGRDKILICEDTDGDGRADKITVFADKLSIPTSLTFARGGVVVHQLPDTLFLKDTDGDGVADERTVLFTGWGTRDTHAGPSNLRYGLDNWLYGIVGYSGFNGTVGGERHRFLQGFYRFRPDGSALEFLRSTNNNSWGVGFSEEGVLFGSTANGNPSEYMPIPNRYYERVRGWSSTVLRGIAGNASMSPITDKVRQVDWHGHFTAAAGHALYTARNYPKDYWNRTAFVCEPTGHLAATFVIEPDGAGYRSRNAWNLVASDDEWAAPIAAEVGPDGNVWLIDWYNFIVQHNPTPQGFKTGKGAAYETPLRDKTHGRIYRLVPTGASTSPAFTLAGATPEKLVATLKNDNMFWRLHAQRLLVERGKDDVVPALLALVRDTSVDGIGLNPGAIHALWTLHGLGQIGKGHEEVRSAVESALHHPSAGVRRNAALVLAADRGTRTAQALTKLLTDADAQVRLAALLALADQPADELAAAALVDAIGRPEVVRDHWLPDALTSAAAVHTPYFLTTLARKNPALTPRAREAVAVVAEHYARGGPADQVTTLIAALAGAEPATAEAVLGGLVRGWPKDLRAKLSGDADAALNKLFGRLPPLAQGQLVRLAQTWGSQALAQQAGAIVKSLLGVAGDDKAAEAERIAAAKQLVDFRGDDPETLNALLDVVSPRVGPAVANGIIEAVGQSAAPPAAAALLGRYALWPPSSRQAALAALLSRPASARTVLDAMDKGEVPVTDLTPAQKQALAAHPDRRIAASAKRLLERGGGLADPDRQKVIDELTPLLAKTGDAARGKELFKKHCSVCHQHSGEGNKVGPDLTGMAAHPKSELLVHIFDPSRSVEGNFRLYGLTTKDGRSLSGLLASETRTSVELIDAQAQRHVVLRQDIDELAASNKSLMPDGFEKQMSPAEVVDLLEFLTAKGKYLPLPLDKVATVVSTKGMFFGEERTAERLVFPDWKPKEFAGVPFVLVDPQGDRARNMVLLYGPQGTTPPTMPRSVSLPCHTPAKAIHLLSGISGWGFPLGEKGSVSLIVRLHYAGGATEDHPLRNGIHFADYIRVVDVPESKLAFRLQGGKQVRYLAVAPQRSDPIETIEFVKGNDDTAPIIVAVTVETRE